MANTKRRTTNKPNELDDALVRAGRISVRVGFTNASKRQAEEIFLRMFIDSPSSSSLRGMEEANSPIVDSPLIEKKDVLALPDDDNTIRLRGLAQEFASSVVEGDFSPADLQDYLLIHKKDPQKAVDEIKSWMENVYEERKKKDSQQEEQKEARREEKKRERDRFREEVKAAVQGLNGDEDEGKKDGKAEDKVKATKNEEPKTQSEKESTPAS